MTFIVPFLIPLIACCMTGVNYYKTTSSWPTQDMEIKAPIKASQAREWLRQNGYAA